MQIGESSFPRRTTRQVMVGAVPVGGGAPITVQSMTITKTADVEGTLQQIYALAAAGADIVRCTCNEVEAAEGLAQIVPRSPVPIVADIHHQYRMALAALEAGVHCLRLNPGNIRKPEHIKIVAQECKDRGIPIRIGVNGGSLDPKLYEKHGGRVTPEAMVESAEQELAYFREIDFDDVKISVKASSVPLMIEAYRLLADTVDYPLHLGVTEAGPPPAGLLKATAGMATLLAEGIGDTIRYSLTADPVEEARAGRQLLEALGLRERKNIDLIACPSCGRAEIDVIAVAKEAMEAFGEREIPLQVAVMGCVVNGPGEARDADIGIAAGNKRGHLFVKGRNVAVVPEDEMVSTLVEWAEFIHEHGVDAAVARVDTEKAAREAEKDRAALAGRARVTTPTNRAARRADPQARRTARQPRPGSGGPPPTIAPPWPSSPSSHRKPRTSPAGTRTWWPRRSWPTTVRCGARWSSGPTATRCGSGCRPRSTCASRRRAPTTSTSRSSSPRATSAARRSTSRASAPSWPWSPTPGAGSSRSPSWCGPPARPSSASTWGSGSRATATCRCC